MKNIYEAPEITIIKYDSTNVMTTSGYDFTEEGYGDEIIW